MRPFCIVLLYGQCIIASASAFLPIDTHRNTISIRYQTSMQGWLIDVPNSFESDCVLPQISKQLLLSSDKIPNSKFDDDDFDNIIKQITADLPEDDFQVVESSNRRRLLTYHQILQSQFIIISTDTISSPATL